MYTGSIFRWQIIDWHFLLQVFERLNKSDNPPPACPVDLNLAQYTFFLFGKRCMVWSAFLVLIGFRKQSTVMWSLPWKLSFLVNEASDLPSLPKSREVWNMPHHNRLTAWYINIRFIRAPKCESPLEHTWWGLARILTGVFGRIYYVYWYSHMQSPWYVFLQSRIWQGSRGSENDGSRDSTSPTRGMETNT